MTESAAPRAISPRKARKFLVVADGTPESEVAIHFASLRAQHTNGVVTLLAVVPPADSASQWLGVQNLMREEARSEAEAVLHKLAAHVNDYAGIMPELVIREGRLADELHRFIEEDKDIAILVLASGAGKDGPGPLVSTIGNKGFPIPVTVVPGTLTEEAVRALA
ncbi:MAG: universal stress protein [Parvibaculum sp.]|uniref:universal stress protein n=1 Tax=Parvibaculum sp. TaxID=2024848 RepID=UPI00284C8ED9|nr:universal stress protein [Parvibaculum sp.]MDR3500719.1 universal stress protein [Parvibaculum sp.]